MKKLIATRKKKFAGALLPYWIIVETGKEIFMQKYNFEGDLCKIDSAGFVISRIDIKELNRIGIRIDNGQTIRRSRKRFFR